MAAPGEKWVSWILTATNNRRHKTERMPSDIPMKALTGNLKAFPRRRIQTMAVGANKILYAST